MLCVYIALDGQGAALETRKQDAEIFRAVDMVAKRTHPLQINDPIRLNEHLQRSTSGPVGSQEIAAATRGSRLSYAGI